MAGMPMPLRAAVLALALTGAALSGRAAVAQTPALWTLSDADTTIYLFGTVHRLPPDLGWFTGDIERAFDAADTVVFEANIWSDDAGAALHGDADRDSPFLDGDKTLRDLLTEEQYAMLDQLAHDALLPLPLLNRLRPLGVVGALDGSIMYLIGMRAPEGADNVLYARATKAEKRLGYLETLADQLAVLAMRASLDVEVEILADHLRRGFDDPRRIERMINLWNAGHAEATREATNMISDGLSDPAKAYLRGWQRGLLHDRNVKWVPQIEAMLQRPGTVFIAVGAAHLAGDDSVIKMLRDRGHAIEGPGEPLDFTPVRLPY